MHRFDRNTYGYSIKHIELLDEYASSPLLLSPTNYTLIHYTPHYLYAPTVPFEMKRFYPEPESIKFIVMLRQPINRALSSYWFLKSHMFAKDNKDHGMSVVYYTYIIVYCLCM